MLYTIFISLIFISEIIIATTLLVILLRIDLRIINANKNVEILNPKIKDVCKLSKAISLQLKELSKIFVEKIKHKSENISAQCFTKLLGAIILWNVNIKLIKKFKHYKFFKFMLKALRVVSNMV